VSLIFLYSKSAVRKVNEKINRERKEKNLSTDSITFLVVHHPLMVEKKTDKSP
jgi:hypothetical protein